MQNLGGWSLWWLSLKEEPRVMLYHRPGSGALLGSSLLFDIVEKLYISLDGGGLKQN